MSGVATGDSLPKIASLPSSTAQLIKSGQTLADPYSVVKELIDNALDARAKSVFIDISANILDSIQVKDDGHGIAVEDRALVCRRYCTSKLRDLSDLREAGSRWLGFRGEALASMAEMSGSCTITTRVEGEAVAARMKYERNGELASTERTSHPCGTTVKISKLFEHVPVRKQMLLKGSSKTLSKIRQILQAYIIARPAVRFRLHILKVPNNQSDLAYVPKSGGTVRDAVLNLFGKECSKKGEYVSFEDGGYNIRAFLPKLPVEGLGTASHGVFVSIDSRPLSSQRGMVKRITRSLYKRLRSAEPDLATTYPFFCIDIGCPSGSYDANIEPLKDDVLFDDEASVLATVDRLFESFYSKSEAETKNVEELTKTDIPSTPASMVQGVLAIDSFEEGQIRARQLCSDDAPRWRSSMYGVDDDDLPFIERSTTPNLEVEPGVRDVSVSNPWTIARMNAAVKPRGPTSNGQLLSPAKSQGNVDSLTTPIRAAKPLLTKGLGCLTPFASPQRAVASSQFEDNIRLSNRSVPLDSSSPLRSSTPYNTADRPASAQAPITTPPRGIPTQQSPSASHKHFSASGLNIPNPIQLTIPGSSSLPPPRGVQNLRTVRHVSLEPTFSDSWFGQPLRNSPAPPKQKRKKPFKPHNFPAPGREREAISYGHVRSDFGDMPAPALASNDDGDIRTFFGGGDRSTRSLDRLDFHGASDILMDSEEDKAVHLVNVTQLTEPDVSMHLNISSLRPTTAKQDDNNRTSQDMKSLFLAHSDLSLTSSSPVRKADQQHNTPIGKLSQISSCCHSMTTDGGSAESLCDLVMTVQTDISKLARLLTFLPAPDPDFDPAYPENQSVNTPAISAFDMPVVPAEIDLWAVRITTLLVARYGNMEGMEADPSSILRGELLRACESVAEMHVRADVALDDVKYDLEEEESTRRKGEERSRNDEGDGVGKALIDFHEAETPAGVGFERSSENDESGDINIKAEDEMLLDLP